MEYFLSNEIVLEEVYNMVFSTGGAPQNTYTPADGERHTGSGGAHNINTSKSEGKLKYTFNYGKEIVNVAKITFERIWKC